MIKAHLQTRTCKLLWMVQLGEADVPGNLLIGQRWDVLFDCCCCETNHHLELTDFLLKVEQKEIKGEVAADHSLVSPLRGAIAIWTAMSMKKVPSFECTPWPCDCPNLSFHVHCSLWYRIWQSLVLLFNDFFSEVNLNNYHSDLQKRTIEEGRCD